MYCQVEHREGYKSWGMTDTRAFDGVNGVPRKETRVASMRVITCLTTHHNFPMVALASLFCLFGSGVTISLFMRLQSTLDPQRPFRLMLAGVSAGTTFWCTHFIAMLGYETGVATTYEPVQTALSLTVAIMGSSMAFWIASRDKAVSSVFLGGMTLGLAIAVMHYLGMSAYVVDGTIKWRYPYVLLSVVFAVLFGTGTLFSTRYFGRALALPIGGFLLILSIMCLHFLGMAAIKVSSTTGGQFSTPSSEALLGLAAAGMGVIVMGMTLVMHVIDLQSGKETTEKMRQLAMSDLLTELPNRAYFADHLDHMIERTEANGGRFAVLVIDLDHLKDINDLRGYAAGDQALRLVAQRMKSVLLPGEVVARLSGDEFAAVNVVSEQVEAGEFASRLHGAICRAMRLDDGLETILDASIGISIYPDDGTTAEGILGNAELAMYRAKFSSNGSISFYSRELDETVRARRQVVTDMRVALGEDQFELYYQVQTSLSTNETLGYEALLRWNHPKKGIILAEDFILTAEETGLILPIGEWVLRQACEDAMTWERPYKVAVNLSSVQFAHSDLPGLVERVLSETGLPPQRLELELTETTFMSEPEHNIEFLKQIQSMGVSIALDDFGTGCSSLSTLRRFRFNRIKLDRSFLAELDRDVQAKAIVRAVIAMGDGLGIPVLAEGIESEDQLAFLIYEGCAEAQGYLIGRPGRLELSEGGTAKT